MKKHTVVLVYTAYAFYDVEAKDKDAAEEIAWREFEKSPPEPIYGEWEVSDIEEHEVKA
jgi:hypothetical protein